MKSAFFYGLFMDPDILIQKGLNPGPPEPARLKDYGLRIGARATLEMSAGEQTYGSVMQLSEDELEQLYAEQAVADYVPESVVASSLGGAIIPAVCYILPIEKLTGRNRAYAASLALAAERIGLPGGYVKEIRTWA